MGKDKSVHKHSVLTVVSSTPVKPGKACPVTPLDHAFGQHSLHVIFYFRSSLGFDQVRPALNEVLSLYPNVTGRLAKDGDGNCEIKCTDAGVRLFRAKVGVTIDEWLSSAGLDDEMNLVATEDLPDEPHLWAPFRMQITDFEGGSAISLTCPHMLADSTSITLLIKSWTETHRREAIAHPPFQHPLSVVPPADIAALRPYYAAKLTDSNSFQKLPKMSSATFCFSDSRINECLSNIRPTVHEASPFDILTALFWTRIMKLKKNGDNQDCTNSISICTDMRKRLSAPLPYGYFGNALHFSCLTLDTKELDKEETYNVAELVHRHVAGLKEEEFWSAVDWLRSRKDGEGKLAPPFRMYGLELTFVNMEHMIAPVGTHGNEHQPFMYMARFDKDEKPAHVSYHVGNVEGEGLVTVMPSAEEGLARRVAVTLPEDELANLLKDTVILGLEPVLLLGGRQ